MSAATGRTTANSGPSRLYVTIMLSTPVCGMSEAARQALLYGLGGRWIEGPAPAYVPDVCGEVIDIGAAIAGEPESMVAYRSAPTLTGVVRILINRVGSAGTSDAMVAKVGAMACALCQTIECLGRPLEVWTVAALRRHGEQVGPGQPASHELLIRVKAGGEPIDPRRLAYAMGNRQWERTLEFFYLDSHDDARVRAYGEADDYAIGAKSYAESSLVIPHLYGTLATKVTVAQLEDQMLVWLRNAGVLMSKADE